MSGKLRRRCRHIQINFFATSSFKHIICWVQENTGAAVVKKLIKYTVSQMPEDFYCDHILITPLVFFPHNVALKSCKLPC